MRGNFLNNLINQFGALRGGRQPDGQDKTKGTEFLQAIVENETEALRIADAAKTDSGPSVILKPIIRTGPGEAGWFGGEPMLSATVDWPEIDGVPLCFLAQIDLAMLPKNIWSGLGPREGFLVFFNHPHRCAAKVLHVRGDLSPRAANVPVPSYRWSHDRSDADQRSPSYNRFPVTATAHSGKMPEPVGWMPGRSSRFPPPFGGDDERLDVTNPQHLPFDTESLDSLIKYMSDAIDMRLTQCAYQLERDPLDTARNRLLSIQSEANTTRNSFDAAVRDVKGVPYDQDRVADFVRKTGPLGLTKFELIRDARNKVADIKPVSMALLGAEPVTWKSQYLLSLNSRLFECFVQKPDLLPPEHRFRIEQICEFWATHESGGMSHAPHGFIYTAHGKDSANEVLLELPSSKLTGWKWGDCHSLVFLIDRSELARGDFNRIKVDITN